MSLKERLTILKQKHEELFITPLVFKEEIIYFAIRAYRGNIEVSKNYSRKDFLSDPEGCVNDFLYYILVEIPAEEEKRFKEQNEKFEER